jgi:hypothetical protein
MNCTVKTLWEKDETGVAVDAEPLREVQRRLDQEEVDQRGEPERQVRRVAGAQPPYGVDQRQHGPDHDQQLEHRHRPVGEVERVAQRRHRVRVPAGEAQRRGDPVGGGVAAHAHRAEPRTCSRWRQSRCPLGTLSSTRAALG